MAYCKTMVKQSGSIVVQMYNNSYILYLVEISGLYPVKKNGSLRLRLGDVVAFEYRQPVTAAE
jgi:hypothetical protein